MKAIILAGGKGTRLRGLVSEVPKPMAPVNGIPFLEIILNQLIRSGITEIVLSVGYKKELIAKYFGDGSRWHVSLEYAVEDAPLGTGGAIRNAMNVCHDDEFLVLNGDSYFDIDISEFLVHHMQHEALVTLALVEMPDSGRYGSVRIGRYGEVESFLEKSQKSGGFVNAGIYLIKRTISRFLPAGSSSFELDILPQLIGNGLYGIPYKGYFTDIGTPEDYLRFRNESGNLIRMPCV